MSAPSSKFPPALFAEKQSRQAPDLTRVINAIHTLPDWSSVVLVGGQSLTAWVEYYKIKLPTLKVPT